MSENNDGQRVFGDMPAGELVEYAFSLIDSAVDPDLAIEQLMVRMTAYFNVDIIVVREKTERGAAIKCTYEVSKNGNVKLKGLERRFLGNAWSEWDERYKRGGGCYKYKKSMGESPMLLMREDAVKSLIVIPIYNDGNFKGTVDFYDSENERDWTDSEIAEMKSISDIMFRYMFSLRSFAEKYEDLRNALKKDALTRLPKVDEFIKYVNDSISTDKNMDYVIISSDIANFKYINEKYGYNTGDLLLTKFAEMIYRRYKRVVSCCREFSDIFLIAIKCKKGESAENVCALVDQCNMSFLEEIKPITEDTNVAVNSGFAFVGDNELTVSEAITGATAARKAAKDMTVLKGSRSKAYEHSMIASKARTLEMISHCDEAIEKGQFQVYFQPKVRCNNYEIIGAEALIRWKKDDGKYILPDEFIPAFENNGCIVKADYYVYEQVFKYLRERLDKGLRCVPVSMNVSRVHLFNTKLVTVVDRLLERYKVPVELLEFEITENVYLDRLPAVMFTVQWLRKMNIRVSIDDFGSGYSSLDTIAKLPVTTLKLDKVFMKDRLDEKDKIVISAVVDMAKKLGMDTICEGVETEEQKRFLEEAGCEKLQGFIFSKPVTMQEFSRMLEIE